MAIRDQSKFPELSEISSHSPMLSNLSFDHQAWLHPMQSYIWMHNLYKACRDIMGVEMPEVQQKRFTMMENLRFMEDHSGRSTGKTHNYLVAGAIMNICCNRRDSVWLGQEKEVGVEVFDKYYGEWIEYEENFSRFVTGLGNNKKPKVSHTQSGGMVRFFNGSRTRSLSPDPRRDYKKMQTWRFNDGIFNEWTSWPYIREIPDKIEPIFTGKNYIYRQTRLFREAMEKILDVELGRLTNDDLASRHVVEDYIPRDYLEGAVALPWDRALELFYRNFEATYGFDYRDGVKDEDIQFEEIRNDNSIVMFFKNYDEGDPAYFNKLVYDGSAKRPSDDCYWMHKLFTKKIKEGNKLYEQYRIGVSDIPVEWDGIIFDSTIVEKARKEELTEDFKRIWEGLWTEGRAKNPFAWLEVVRAAKEGWLGEILRHDVSDIYIGAVDSAQGTDATFKTREGVSDGRGDDGIVAVYKLGDGTPSKPHMLANVYIVEDVRSEPMAYDVQDIESRFGVTFYMIDPGGGGKGVLEKLAKDKVEKTDYQGEKIEKDVVPMVLWDHEDPRDAKTNISIFSLSNELITTAYIDSKTGKALLHFADQLNNQMVRLMQDALRDKTVAFPQYLEQDEIVDLYNTGKINDEELGNLMDMRKGLGQMVHLRYTTDRSNRRTKTKNGVFTYEAPGNSKKDAAWTILMGHMMCDIMVKLKKIQEMDDDEVSPYIPYVEGVG